MKGLSDQRSNTDSQRPRGITLGTGRWHLEIDTPLSMTCASALRLAATTVAVLLVGGSTSVFACPVCFGAAESSMIDGAKLGVLVLLAVTVAVQGAFVAFFLYLRKRARRIAEIDLDTEWSKLQDVPRTS
jgi:hypothetical protein